MEKLSIFRDRATAGSAVYDRNLITLDHSND